MRSEAVGPMALDTLSVQDSLEEYDGVLELNQFDGLPYSSRFYTLLKERKNLPIWNIKSDFMDALVKEQVVIVAAATATGRSSQIPEWCTEFCLSLQFRHGTVACSQTQAQQAVDLALRVADEMDVNIGHEVGYSIPLQTCCADDTVLRYCTDDTLLREMMSDPLLERYAVVVVDQVHQRTVATDILQGLLKNITLQRPDLRVVLLTATRLSPKHLSLFSGTTGPPPVIHLDSQTAGEVVYSDTGESYFCSALRLVLEIHRSEEDGDVVVFLVTSQEIELALDILHHESLSFPPNLGRFLPIAVHPDQSGSLTTLGENDPSRTRRVFLTASPNEDFFWAVNSVNFVIDVGLEKRNVYNPRIRTNTVTIQPISASQARSRKQLVGPTGKCFCIYPEDRQLPDDIRPHIVESDVTSTVLFLKRMEIAGLGQCDFIDKPGKMTQRRTEKFPVHSNPLGASDPEGLMQALEELDYLAALDDDGNLSEIGIIMSEFPVQPQLAKALLASCEFDCVSELLVIAAMLTAPTCFKLPADDLKADVSRRHAKFHHPEGDHFTLINIFTAFKRCRQDPRYDVDKWCSDFHLDRGALMAADILHVDMADTLARIELPVSAPAFSSRANSVNVRRALLAGFFMQVARDVDGSGNFLILTNKHVAQIHRPSGYCAKSPTAESVEWLLFHEHSFSLDNCLRIVTPIAPEEFIQMVPQYFFSNLPQSESKVLLQNILDSSASRCGDKKATNSQQATTHDRCLVQ
ncbi:putative pre-mRNA-splicing factor ATP-dependent RNA helicase DHX32 isoform X1 [Phyllopteryx taeniolatus]|uniref:putative pre-mRNA-splicing factor ATP-dependent RNA helicase DHX32 isoform X1 n=1 Tax=Phyllopteryx taeniolatus TaxID=161469 RepID=UPI002AD1FA85|nr:putative pre-mRNA-splicing factor ATP-dependent RNA helicase DHX32 isoform X1 [Phyllopteryx taeniolatus]